MRWSELLFMHWPADPALVARLLPPGLDLDLWDGRAWIGVVPFRMSRIRMGGWLPVPGVSEFPELNVRTYARFEGQPGVWFFSLDAAHALAVRVARRLYHLNYLDADMECRMSENGVAYRSRRTHRGEPEASLEVRYRGLTPGKPAAPGSFEQWLTQRYCLFAADSRSRLFQGEIDHAPWSLAAAEVQLGTNSMGRGHLGLELDGPPHALLADPLDVDAWDIRRVR